MIRMSFDLHHGGEHKAIPCNKILYNDILIQWNISQKTEVSVHEMKKKIKKKIKTKNKKRWI